MNSCPRKSRYLWKSSAHGFTLIEIVVVLFFMALLASVVALSASGMVRGATLEEVVGRIDFLDQEARRTAKRLGSAIELDIDCETRRFILRDPQTPSAPPLAGLTVPATFELDQAWRLSRGEPQNDTTLLIRYEPDGTATTWGLTIADRNTQSELISVVLLGATGQMTQWENHEQAQDIFAEALGRHAD